MARERVPGARTPTAVAGASLANLWRYRQHAPLWGLRLFVNPQEIDAFVPARARGTSGRVLDGDWDLRTRPLEEHPKISAAIRHWRDGLSWEDAGAYAIMLSAIDREGTHDGCSSIEDVVTRFEHTDRMFGQVAAEGRLRASRFPLIEPDGVLVHIDRDGRAIFGGSGCHRLAAVRVLGLRRIPAKLGGVHPSAVRRWRRFRR